MSTFNMRMLVILSLIATVGLVNAMAQGPIYFAIPFGFTVGPKTFPAGLYSARETTHNVLQIQSKDGAVNTMTMADTSEPSKYKGRAVMSFERYGDRFFLSNVSNPDRGWALPQSVDEKHLIAAAGKTQPAKQLDIVASSRP